MADRHSVDTPGGSEPGPAATAGPRVTAERARRHRRRRIRRIVTGTIAVISIAVLGVGITWASTRPVGSTYRTAVAGMGSVSQVVSAVGQLADADRALAAFPVSGTVATVDVGIGDTVDAGQVLATLDPTDLDDAVDQAQSNLDDAKQTLSDDRQAQQDAADDDEDETSTAAAPASSAPRSSATTAGPGAGTGGGTASDQAAIAAAQDAIIGCRQLVDYLIGKGVTAGTCPAASSTGAAGPAGVPTGDTDMTRTAAPAADLSGPARTGTAAVPAGPSSTVASPTGGTPTAQVPVSEGCSVILSASDAAPATVTVTAGAPGAGSPGGGGGPGAGGPPAGTEPTTVTETQTKTTTETAAETTTETTTVTETVPTTVTETVTETVTSSDDGGAGFRGAAARALVQQGPDGTMPTAQGDPQAQPEGDTPGAAGTDDAPALSGAVADCQSAISGAIAVLTTLYDWQVILDNLLQGTSSGVPGSGSAGSGAAGSGAAGSGGSGDISGVGASVPQGSAGSQGGISTSGGTASAAGGSALGATSTRVPTAADIAADQAQIDLMEARLAVARQNAHGATLTSPIAGTVAQVAIAAGDRVSAASTSAIITIVGRSQYQVTVAIPLTQIDLIKTGQAVTVTVDGVADLLAGSVAMIGVLNESSTSSPSYPVTIRLDPSPETLFDGASASLTIAIGSADQVLAVPTSAVTTSGDRHTVTVLDGTVTSVVTVEIGLVGPQLTEITSGLTAGQVVVLADVDQPMPTSSSGSGSGDSLLGGNQGGGPGGGAVRFAR